MTTLATIFDPAPAMATAAGEARLVAAAAKIVGRVRRYRCGRVEAVRMVRAEVARIKPWHPEVADGEPMFYLLWQVNDALRAAGWDEIGRAEVDGSDPGGPDRPAA